MKEFGFKLIPLNNLQYKHTAINSQGRSLFLCFVFLASYACSVFGELSWSPDSYRLSPYMSEARSPALGSRGTETVVIWSRLQNERWSIDSITNSSDTWGTVVNNISKGFGDAHSPFILPTNAGLYGYWIIDGDAGLLYESSYGSQLWSTPKYIGASIRKAQTLPYSINSNERNERVAAWKTNQYVGYPLAISRYLGSWESPTTLRGSNVESLDATISNNGNTTVVEQSSGNIMAFRHFKYGFSEYITLSEGKTPSLGVDVNGNVVALWAGIFNGLSVIQSATHWGDGESNIWSDTTNVSSIELSSSNPVLWMSPSGNAIAVWQEAPATIKGSMYRSGKWSTPFAIAVAKPGEIVKEPQVAVDDNEYITVAWIRSMPDGNSNVQARHYLSGVWGDIANVSSLVQGQALGPRVSADANGTVTVVWVQYGDGPSSVWAKRASVTTKRTVNLTVNYVGGGKIVSYPSGIDCEPVCSSNFLEGQNVVLSATPSPGSYFTGWSGDCSGKDNCTLNMTSNKSVNANFAPIDVGFMLSIFLEGQGIVTSNPVGISCGINCSETFAKDTQVSLAATPGPGYFFYNWTGACSGFGACTVTMDRAKSVGAVFTASPPNTFALGLTKTGNGTITSSPAGINCGSTCIASFNSGISVTLTATADANSTFTGWSGDCSGSGACPLTMSANKSVTANFIELPKYLVKVTKPSTGVVSSEPAGILCGGPNRQCASSFSSAKLTATPNPGFEFIKWNGCQALEGNICYIKPTGKMSVNAVFKALPKYKVKISKNNLGSVTSAPGGLKCPDKKRSCSVKFVKGTQVTLTAVPQSGRTFVGWTGACAGTDACNLLMDGNKGVGATFQ